MSKLLFQLIWTPKPSTPNSWRDHQKLINGIVLAESLPFKNTRWFLDLQWFTLVVIQIYHHNWLVCYFNYHFLYHPFHLLIFFMNTKLTNSFQFLLWYSWFICMFFYLMMMVFLFILIRILKNILSGARLVKPTINLIDKEHYIFIFYLPRYQVSMP